VVTLSRHNDGVDEARDLVGMFVVRGWLHDGSPVMRLTATPDVISAEPFALMVSSREEIHHEIDRWLHEMEQRQRPGHT
jgi:hypothetical protein